jgi:flagellar basal-body rod modification protein FlgD
VDSLTSENTFLKLLVSQIQNQDPLNPADGVQFLTQLTGYSQLEQLMQINQELAPQVGSSTTGNTATSSSTNSTNPIS